MTNTLLSTVRKTDFGIIGVLLTPCFPASYYAGHIENTNGEWCPFDNATSLFHRSIPAAEAAARQCADQYYARILADEKARTAQESP